MHQCLDCNAWMDADYVNGDSSCPKCCSRALFYHVPAESACELTYGTRLEQVITAIESASLVAALSV